MKEETVYVHYRDGPLDGGVANMTRDAFMSYIETSDYDTEDAWIKDDIEHYQVGYKGSLNWDQPTT